MFERYVNFEFYKTMSLNVRDVAQFERYVNFEFYKTVFSVVYLNGCLRDM